MLRRIAIAAGAAGIVMTVPSAAAQQDKMLRPDMRAEATIYRDVGFNGPAVNVREAKPDLGLAWRVNSIRVRSGRWQLCEKRNYRGNCRIVERDMPRLYRPDRGLTIQSMRPLGMAQPEKPMVPGNNASLRGMAAEFYPWPARAGYRVLACPTGSATMNCAAESAKRFCSAMGWRTATRQSLETVRGRVYLADVLCSNTGT